MTPIFDGVVALSSILARAGYGSILESVAAHTVFFHPDTMSQTVGKAVFPLARNLERRGELGVLSDGRQVMFDDNSAVR